MTALQSARLEEPAHRYGRVAVLGNNGFERAFFSNGRGVLGTQAVHPALDLDFGAALLVKSLANQGNLARKRSNALRDSFELEGELPALSSEALHLRRRDSNFILQALGFTVYCRHAFNGLG